MAPRLRSSSITLMPTLMNPGFVSMTVFGLILPDVSPVATKNGLIDEPGSKMSVAARLR